MHAPKLWGQSRAFRQVLALADEYAHTPWPVLILGESGVGKELLARRIHLKSRVGACFVPVNCGAIPPALFESELFGYERGAFSGAVQSSRGLIRSAQGGTLFLDEIGEMEIPAQVKLLRWLDSGELRSLGSTRIETVETRLIAATHVDLARGVGAGDFRLDLLERLSVLVLRVPSLRERREDVEFTARAFLEEKQVSFEEGALRQLGDFSWPGNVRQLRNVLLRAIARAKGPVTRELLAQLLEEEASLSRALQGGGVAREDAPLAEIEKQVIIDRIQRCRGNKKQAARELGIAKSTLHEKIRRWKMQGRSLVNGHLDRPGVGT